MARLNIAMLSEQAQEQVEVQQQTELEVVGQQAEDAIAEATQIQTDIESAQQAADDAEEVVQQVEEERQVLEQAQKQGGAEQPAMEALQRAMSRFEKRTGVRSSISGMGMESFGSKSTRAQATAIAMEGAVEYIKRIIKMLVDAMAAVWEKVKAFFEKIWVGADRLAKRADKVKESAKAAAGKTAPADAKVTIESALNYARKGGKTIQGKEFADEYVKQSQANWVSRRLAQSELDKFLKDGLPTQLLDAAAKPDNGSKILSLVIEAQPATKGGKSEVVDGMLVNESEPGLGDFVLKTVSVGASSTYEELGDKVSKIKKSYAGPEGDAGKAKELKPIEIADVIKLSNEAGVNMRAYTRMREEQKALDTEIKKIISAAKKSEKESKDEGVSKQISLAATTVRAISNSTISMIVSMRSYEINLCKAALDYAAASVKLASGAKEQKAEEKVQAKAEA